MVVEDETKVALRVQEARPCRACRSSGGNVRIPDAIRPLLINGAVVLAIVFAGVAVWNHQHRELSDARRAMEAAELDRLGLIRSHEKTVAGLNEKIAAMAKDPRLAAALAEAKAAAPGAKATQAGTYSTGSVVVHAAPETIKEENHGSPQAPQAAAGARGIQDGQVLEEGARMQGPPLESERAAQTATGGVASSSPSSSCVLSSGDQASIAVDVVTFETKLGNTFIVGVATAWRETPAPRTQLFGGKFQSALSDVSGLAPPSLPRWGAGLAAACLGFCAAGPAVAFPPLHVFSLQLEANLGALVSDRGFGVAGTAVIRW